MTQKVSSNNPHKLVTHMEANIQWHRDSRTINPRRRATATVKPRHRDPKTFLWRTQNYNIVIPIPKIHDIKLLRNSDPKNWLVPPPCPPPLF